MWYPLVGLMKVVSLISPYQSAYLSGGSAQTVLHAVIDSLSKNVDKGFINAICTLDMAKGFDTVSHDIIMHKFSFCGFSPSSCNFLNHIFLNVHNRLTVMFVFLKNSQLRLVYHKDSF